LVSAFVIILFCQTVKRIPRQLEDSARLDGCGLFGIYRRIVLPLVRRELGFITLLIVMATALPFWENLTAPDRTDFRPYFEFVRLPTYDSFISMLTMSGMTSLSVIAIFFVANRTTPVGARPAE
jgi:multiple sugar transport system permease protein